MVIAHNLLAQNANRQYNTCTNVRAKSAEKLSSGYRINRAADDAAGLAISEKMRRQIRGLTQASINAQDGISMIQTAEGGLNEVHDMLQRYNELAVKAANGTLNSEDREYVNEEGERLKDEINRIAGSVNFNEIQLFPEEPSSNRDMIHYEFTVNLADGTYQITNYSDSYSSSVSKKSANTENIANYISGTLIPNAAAAVLNALPAFDTNAASINVSLDLSRIDGNGGTLAYASFMYSSPGGVPTALPGSFVMKVDTADFTDDNAQVGGERHDLLESTIRHEITHTIMQNVMTKSMVSEMPKWFTEGIAQLTGGGFATGWNDQLVTIAEGLSDANDSSKDGEIKAYLNKYSTVGRPYGHGYLATAYMGYLADGTGDVSAGAIANGMNKILADVMGGKSFDQAVADQTGLSPNQIADRIDMGLSGATEFVRKLAAATGDGAGSIIGDLSQGTQFGGIGGYYGFDVEGLATDYVSLQVGSESGDRLEFALFSINTVALGIGSDSLLNEREAANAIDSVKNALSIVSGIRSYYGSVQNRLEHTINNLNNVVENTTAAESSIRDTDMASEMVRYSVHSILQQVGESMISQANQHNQGVMTLIQ